MVMIYFSLYHTVKGDSHTSRNSHGIMGWAREWKKTESQGNKARKWPPEGNSIGTQRL